MVEAKEQRKVKVHTVYKNADGKRLPSVTTILGILNKPALIHWAWDLGTQGLDYRSVRDDAAGVGTLAHYLIMCDLNGETPDTSEYSAQDIDRAENCLIKYWDWKSQHNLQAKFTEHPLVSEKHGYGGTIDCIAEVGGEIWLVDYKTGKAIYIEMIYQLAAYRELIREAGWEVDQCRILRIGRDDTEGFEEKQFTNLDKAFELFLHCKEIYNLKKEVK